jgi:predicted nucleic acid-binding protein
VLDSYALLAFLGDETGMRRVKEVPSDAAQGRCQVLHSITNLGEVLYITERELGLVSAHAALAAVEQLPIEIIPATKEVVLAAAHIKANYRIAYADAFAVVSAQDYTATLLTGEQEFEQVSEFVGIEWLNH